MSSHTISHSPETGVIVALPALDLLRQALCDGVDGHVANKVPINNGSLQVGFRGAPQSFGAMDVSLTSDGLEVITDQSRPVEGPYVITRHDGTRAVGRATLGPIAKIDLVRDDEPGRWFVQARNERGDVVDVPDEERVVLARTLAKLADVSISKLRKQQKTAA